MSVATPSTRVREAHGRSIAKAISWRVTGSVDTFVLSLIITGSLALAGSIATVEVVTKIILYYFHERAWALIPWGRHGSRAEAPPPPVDAGAEHAFDPRPAA